MSSKEETQPTYDLEFRAEMERYKAEMEETRLRLVEANRHTIDAKVDMYRKQLEAQLGKPFNTIRATIHVKEALLKRGIVPRVKKEEEEEADEEEEEEDETDEGETVEEEEKADDRRSAKRIRVEYPTAEEFGRYVAVQNSGLTNMHDIYMVKALSGLAEAQILFVMQNYSQLAREYRDPKKAK
jgi:hypothetical protein